jgi:hypothetical protein
MKSMKWIVMAFACVFAVMAHASDVEFSRARKSVPDVVAAQLRHGGYYVLIANAETSPDTVSTNQQDACVGQRRLSVHGRNDALVIGMWYRDSHIAIDSVRSGDVCRSRDTADIAFGNFELWKPLNGHFEKPDDRKFADTSEVKKLLAQPTQSVHVFVTQPYNIQELMDSDAPTVREGDQVVVMPNGTGSYQVVAILPISAVPSHKD